MFGIKQKITAVKNVLKDLSSPKTERKKKSTELLQRRNYLWGTTLVEVFRLIKLEHFTSP